MSYLEVWIYDGEIYADEDSAKERQKIIGRVYGTSGAEPQRFIEAKPVLEKINELEIDLRRAQKEIDELIKDRMGGVFY